MATHDYVIDNSTGANVRADINNVLQAILTNNSSSSAPSTTAAYMFWADTTTGTLKIRNSSDNAWVELLQLDGTLTLEDGSASTPALAFRDDLNTGIYSSSADTFNIATGGIERMELGGTTIFNEDGRDVDFRIEGDNKANLFYVDAGNDRIIIGASSATAGQFAVNDTNGNHIWLIGRSSDDKSAVSFRNNADDAYRARIEVDQSNGMKFQVAGSERARIDTSGRLLIGTTSARSSGGSVNAHLQLEGTTSQGAELLITRNTADTFSPTLGLVKTRGTSVGSNTAVQDNDVLGKIQFRGADGSDIFSVGASIFARVNGTPSDGTDMPAELVFATTADGASSPTERMFINSSGNVGIGTSSPTQKLAVDGNIILPDVGTVHFGVSDTAYVRGKDSTDGYIKLGTAGTDRVHVDHTGNVGIGTTSPSRKLEITDATFSALRIKNSSTSIANGTNICGIEFEHADSSAAGVCAGINALMADTSTGALHMTFSTGTNVNLYRENMRIASDGTVQIAAGGAIAGFSSSHINSGAPLKIYKSSGSTHAGLQLIWDHFNTTAGIKQKIQFTIGDDASSDGFNNAGYIAIEKADSWQSGAGRSSAMVFATTSAATESEAMRIRSDGNVGIGSSNPPTKLDVFKTGNVVTGRFGCDSAAAVCCDFKNTISSGTAFFARFIYTGSECGSITASSTGSTAYNTSSDYRLKENEVEISDGITRLKTLKPYRFNWKKHPDLKVDGFFAHEVTAVPEAITGTKDEVATEDNDGLGYKKGDPIYQSLDQSKLVPLITAALKEAIGKIEVLETKVAALEAA